METVQVPDPGDAEAALAAVLALRRLANRVELEAVSTAMAQGWTWAQVGDALGISSQAAHKKFARALTDPAPRSRSRRPAKDPR